MTKISTKVKLMLRSILLKAGSLETDKGILLFDGEYLNVGDEVFVENAEGEIVPAEDGEYEVNDKVFVIKDGKVEEIRDKAVEDEPAAETEVEVVEAEEVPEPADEEVEVQQEEESVEDRIARLEETAAQLREGIEAITNAVAAVAKRLEAVEEKLSGLEEPAADPAEEGEEQEEKYSSRLSYLRKK